MENQQEFLTGDDEFILELTFSVYSYTFQFVKFARL